MQELYSHNSNLYTQYKKDKSLILTAQPICSFKKSFYSEKFVNFKVAVQQ